MASGWEFLKCLKCLKNRAPGENRKRDISTGFQRGICGKQTHKRKLVWIIRK
jgi:hypothetical protein